MRRKLHTALPSERPVRAPCALPRRGSRLPTIAALVSAFAALSVAPDAAAVIASASDASVDAADAGDAGEDSLPPWVPPEGERVLGGVPPSTRVHGSGCGCGSEGRDGEVATALGAASMLGLALIRRRKR